MQKTVIWTTDPESAKPIVELLEKLGFETKVASTLVQMLSNASPVPPELVLIEKEIFKKHEGDFGMVKTAVPQGCIMPLVWYSDSPPSKEELETALERGVVDFWLPPFTEENYSGRVGARVAERAKIDGLLQRITDRDDELDMARKVQEQLLPKKYPNVQGVRFAARYVPTEQVGGDFYDLLDFREESAGIFIADVSGHGVPAAFTTMSIKTSISTWARGIVSPGETMILINSMVQELLEGSRYVTSVFGHLDGELLEFTFANAGHPAPVLFRENEKEPLLLQTEGGYPLGIIPDALYPETTVSLKPKDFLLLYTDGITEAQNTEREFYGEERLYETVRKYIDRDADTILDELLKDAIAFVGKEEIRDDINLVGIQIEDQAVSIEESLMENPFGE
ncbi:MAG: PP2C family protein-serine/threonine phosphatase [Planctomycetota bacterium]